jgi:SAM-dependent methyltransferase
MKLSGILIHIPFSYMWTLKKIAGNPRTVLDIGCGNGEIMRIIGDKKWKITGLDIYPDSLKQAKATGMYTELIKGDLIKVCNQLVKKNKKYDLVFCSQVIEHITKKDGEKLLELADKLAKKRIYFGTPLGFMHQPHVFYKGNPHQHHKSGWELEEFTRRGYSVHGVGFKPIWSESGLGRTENKVFEFVLTAVGYFVSPFVYYFPRTAAGILAEKNLQ